jgi:hypothetical protein
MCAMFSQCDFSALKLLFFLTPGVRREAKTDNAGGESEIQTQKLESGAVLVFVNYTLFSGSLVICSFVVLAGFWCLGCFVLVPFLIVLPVSIS